MIARTNVRCRRDCKLIRLFDGRLILLLVRCSSLFLFCIPSSSPSSPVPVSSYPTHRLSLSTSTTLSSYFQPPLFLYPPFSVFFVHPLVPFFFFCLPFLPLIPLSTFPLYPYFSFSTPSPPTSLPTAPSPLCRALKMLNHVTVARLCDLAPS